MANTKGGKKGRKIDRNRIWCKAYRLRRQRERNKIKRLDKHLGRYPDDKCAIAAKERCEHTIRL